MYQIVVQTDPATMKCHAIPSYTTYCAGIVHICPQFILGYTWVAAKPVHLETFILLALCNNTVLVPMVYVIGCYLNWCWYLFRLLLWDVLECCPAQKVDLVNCICWELKLLQCWLLPPWKHNIRVFSLVVVTLAGVLPRLTVVFGIYMGCFHSLGDTCHCAILSSRYLFENGLFLLLLAFALLPTQRLLRHAYSTGTSGKGGFELGVSEHGTTFRLYMVEELLCLYAVSTGSSKCDDWRSARLFLCVYPGRRRHRVQKPPSCLKPPYSSLPTVTCTLPILEVRRGEWSKPQLMPSMTNVAHSWFQTLITRSLILDPLGLFPATRPLITLSTKLYHDSPLPYLFPPSPLQLCCRCFIRQYRPNPFILIQSNLLLPPSIA